MSQQGTGMDVAEMGVPGHSGSLEWAVPGYRINNTVGRAIVAAVAQFLALENPHGQNENKISVERASAFSQTCHHIPVLLCVPGFMRCCSENWPMGERELWLCKAPDHSSSTGILPCILLLLQPGLCRPRRQCCQQPQQNCWGRILSSLWHALGFQEQRNSSHIQDTAHVEWLQLWECCKFSRSLLRCEVNDHSGCPRHWPWLFQQTSNQGPQLPAAAQGWCKHSQAVQVCLLRDAGLTPGSGAQPGPACSGTRP